MKKKVLICEFFQESNSFCPLIWDIGRFKAMILCGGLKMRLLFTAFKSPVKGMARAVREAGGRPCFGFSMRAISGGPVSDDAMELFVQKTRQIIEKKGPFDAVLLSLHGATISQSQEDVCGYVVKELRKTVGRDVLIGLACDLHANITVTMEENADYICGFQTYPHIDIYETGYRAAKLVMNAFGGNKPKQVYARFPMIVPASGYTTSEGRFYEIMHEGFEYVGAGHAEDFTVFMMQPWLDVSDAQSCVTIVSYEPEKAEAEAKRIAQLCFDSRSQFWPEKSGNDDILNAVLNRCPGKPVIWAEPADSPNAGAVGDGVELLKTILSWDKGIKAATTVMDPAAVKKASEIGAGKCADFTLGAGYTPGMPGPLTLNCKVISLHRGVFHMAGPMARGAPISIGKAVVLQCENVDILVCERPGGTGDVNYYKGFGMNWRDYDLMVVKANTSFRVCYKDIADSIFVADTYGAASADLTSLPFKYIDKNRFYPFTDSPFQA